MSAAGPDGSAAAARLSLSNELVKIGGVDALRMS
jgi:hypothetical protein